MTARRVLDLVLWPLRPASFALGLIYGLLTPEGP